MRLGIRMALVAALFLMCSCAVKKAPVEMVPPTEMTGQILFETAEKAFEEGRMAAALEGYGAYLAQFERGTHAPAALIKSGVIHTFGEEMGEAESAYEALLDRFPEDPLAKDAGAALLELLLLEGRFEAVVGRSAMMLTWVDSKPHLFRILFARGDALAALGEQVEAVKAYAAAMDKGDMPGDEAVTGRLRKALEKLDGADVENLLSVVLEPSARGWVLHRKALNLITAEENAEAVALLKLFAREYVFHDAWDEANELLDALVDMAAFDPYVVGCLLPLSGPYERFGQRALRGVELALGETSRAGSRYPFRLIIRDTKSDPVVAAAMVEELAAEGVSAIVGPIAAAVAAAGRAQELGVPMIVLTQKRGVTDLGDGIFRNFLTPRMQVRALVAHAMGELSLSRFAILYPDEPYGRTFMNLFWDEVLARGGEVTGVEAYKPAHTDFAGPIKKMVGRHRKIPEDLLELYYPAVKEVDDQGLRANDGAEGAQGRNRRNGEDEEPKPIVDFDAVFIPDSPSKAGLILPQLSYYDVNHVWLLGTNLWHSEKIVAMARKESGRSILPEGFFARSEVPVVGAFVTRFDETFGNEPGFMAAVSYDTAMILFSVLDRPDVDSVDAFKGALSQLSGYPGVTGITAFHQGGEAEKELYMLGIHRGQFVELARSSGAVKAAVPGEGEAQAAPGDTGAANRYENGGAAGLTPGAALPEGNSHRHD